MRWVHENLHQDLTRVVFADGLDVQKSECAVMDEIELIRRIDLNPKICCGRLRIAGTRIRFRYISALAAGETVAQIVEDFPYLTEADVLAAVAYAQTRSTLV